MSDTRPPACYYEPRFGERVTREHRESCPDPMTHRGCAPCSAPHCVICGVTHSDNDHPLTCPGCIGRTRRDLTELVADITLLAPEAVDAGRDGHLVAAAPIPGGTAQVLIGPTVRLDVLRVSREMSKDHRVDDPIPPLAILAQWEDIVRSWIGHDQPPTRESIDRAVTYLLDHLPLMAQGGDRGGRPAPDYLTFVQQIRKIRSHLDRALHDEQQPERGVKCFECPDRLVRRFGRPTPCRHTTAARTWFEMSLRLSQDLNYPELLPTILETRAAMQPCGGGECDQGGIDDPSAGQSWECLNCGKDYSPEQYAAAVRRSLIDGDGWTNVTFAAAGASTLIGRTISEWTIRDWMRRGWISTACEWKPKQRHGIRVVPWPEVMNEARRLASGKRRAHSDVA